MPKTPRGDKNEERKGVVVEGVDEIGAEDGGVDGTANESETTGVGRGGVRLLRKERACGRVRSCGD